ncbi:MAG: tRNA 2-thiocytidine biosynthesis protein TtcA [Paludibacteraceae bacterium]|nr:tRNA 2-thiocytidine biosynthesis protein TtcA [Paludibacteraceae bacterium]
MRTPEQIELSRLQNRLTKRFHKACADYSLIENGDHILIALSGGKDSLALVELLGKRAQIFVPRFKVTALHVRVKERAYISDLSYLQSFCDAFRVPLLVRDTSIGESSVSASGVPTNNMQWGASSGLSSVSASGVPTNNMQWGASGGLSAKRSNPCFLCSWYRRKALFDTAQELGCNKIAFGHHKDDIVETLLMNLVFEGKFSTIYPKLQMDKMPLQLIRPLCLIEERDLRRYAELQGYVRQKQPCPFEHDSVRSNIKDLVTQLEQLNPNVRDSLWGAIARR